MSASAWIDLFFWNRGSEMFANVPSGMTRISGVLESADPLDYPGAPRIGYFTEMIPALLATPLMVKNTG
jgi:hypothetical protein